MQVWMVFGAVFCFRKIFGEILQKIGEISSRPSGNTDKGGQGVNFINILRANFLCECLFGNFFLPTFGHTYLRTNIEKSCRNDVHTKNL